MIKKAGLCFLLVVLLIGSTQAVSTYAPDQLALTPGSYSSGITSINIGLGDSTTYIEYATTYKVLGFIDFPDVSKKLVRFGMSITIVAFPDNEPNVIGLEYDYESLVWYHNRTLAVPMSYLKITNGTTEVEASLLGEDTFAGVSNLNNMVVTLSDGREFLWEDFLTISSLEYEAVILSNYVQQQWSNDFYIQSKEQYAISPEASVGQLIDYGWFDGEVVNTFVLNLGGGKTHEVIKVHVDYTESSLICKGETTMMVIAMFESEFLYEAKTGLIANFTQFDFTGFPVSQFIATDIHIADSDDSGNTLTIPYDYLFSILGLGFMISLVILHKRKK